MEGISFVTVVFFYYCHDGRPQVLLKSIDVCHALVYMQYFSCSSSNSYLISSFVCRIALNFLGRPTGCFYIALWISFSCVTCFNKSISCCKILKCSSFVMGFNNSINMFFFFCWVHLGTKILFIQPFHFHIGIISFCKHIFHISRLAIFVRLHVP